MINPKELFHQVQVEKARRANLNKSAVALDGTKKIKLKKKRADIVQNIF